MLANKTLEHTRTKTHTNTHLQFMYIVFAFMKHVFAPDLVVVFERSIATASSNARHIKSIYDRYIDERERLNDVWLKDEGDT